jgi:hypothetical protein
MKNTVFIHTNAKQMVGAIVGRHSLKRNSANPDAFDVKIISKEEFSFFDEFEGKKFLRGGKWRTWQNADLQSFTPVRFMPPELMGYQNRAVVIDPDVFAVGDVNELFERDMEGKALFAKPRPGHKGKDSYMASSVMLMDCAKLPHWNVKKQFEEMFAGRLDYEDWIELRTEPEGSVGFLESYWNDFDRLAPDTKLIHNTKRRTQPWKCGLPIDFMNRPRWYMRFLPVSGYRKKGTYLPHPDPRQEQFFFALVKECVAAGEISEEMLKAEMANNHVRHDAPEMIESAPAVDQILAEVRAAA